MRLTLLAVTLLAGLGHAEKPAPRTVELTIQDKHIQVASPAVNDGDTLKICNGEAKLYHMPFSYSRHNKFESGTRRRSKGIPPGGCTTHVARNPTSRPIKLDIA